jgi:hypothetical protein
MPRAQTLLPPPPIESIPALFAVLTPRASEVRVIEIDPTEWERRETDIDELMQSSDSWPDDYPTWPIEETCLPPSGFALTATYGFAENDQSFERESLRLGDDDRRAAFASFPPPEPSFFSHCR